MSELYEYHQNLMADIRREADASGVIMVEAFFDKMTERLTEAGELEVADRAYFQSGAQAFLLLPAAASLQPETMNRHTPIHEFVGVGLYSVADAAQLLKAPPRTLRRWLDGYDYKRNDEIQHVAPLWKPDIPKIDDEIELSFRDLIELRFVRAFLDNGIGLKAVRNCLEYARQCIQTDRPFSSGRFRTDGRTIFLESLDASAEPKLLDLKAKQYVFKQVVEQSFKDLDLEGDIVTRWRPYRGKDSIVVDPTRSFGQPVASASGVPTIVLAESVKAEGSVSRVAAMYEVEKSVVQDAVKFHEELMAA